MKIPQSKLDIQCTENRQFSGRVHRDVYSLSCEHFVIVLGKVCFFFNHSEIDRVHI